MRAPSTQTRILAFAPIQLCAWASALFFGYHYFYGAPVFWPAVITVAFLFYDVGQHGGASALLGVVLLFIIPLLVIGLVLKLIGRVMRRKAAKAMPVTVCVSRSLLPAPDMKRAYRDLPAHCRAILRTVP